LENEEERLGSQIRQAIATRKKKAAGPGKEESSTVKKKPGPWAALMSVEKGATFSLYMVRLKRNLWLLKDGMLWTCLLFILQLCKINEVSITT
jgi:hypothetical protein